MRVIFWFRKSLRLHDNPALHQALQNNPDFLLPIFCLDPAFVKNSVMKVGVRRWQHLLETLQDLDGNLKKLTSSLLVARGDPLTILPKLIKEYKIDRVYYEKDTEPYAIARDKKLSELHPDIFHGVLGHTLFEPQDIIKATGKKTAPLTYRGFLTTVEKLSKPPRPLETPKRLPEFTTKETLPTVQELGLTIPTPPTPHPGGETEALKRLEQFFSQTARAATFEKPETNPAMMWPTADTTVLSPYLKFGSLSCRTFYHRCMEVYSKHKHSSPPTSLLGQLYWREFYYTIAATTHRYDSMEGNSVCLQVDWQLTGPMYSSPSSWKRNNPKPLEQLEKWRNGQTGFPWIDAIMRQLRTEGWIHHLARHSVACFLTRGDCYISWERGAEVFEELLLDADPALNIGNWLWLSSSAFFTQYFRVYSPVAFPTKYKPHSHQFIRKYVPELAQFPEKYLLEPWKAPKAEQTKAGCIIGQDYPKPMLDHAEAMKDCIAGLKAAYERKQYGDATKGMDPDEEEIRGDVPGEKRSISSEEKPNKKAKITEYFK